MVGKINNSTDEISIEINKDVYMTEGKINVGKFVWKENRFSTNESTTLWFESLYPLLEGGILAFTIYNNNPCKIQVYVNQLNIFDIALNRRHVYYSSNDLSFKKDAMFKEINNRYKDDFIDNKINIKIPAQYYSKIIIDVQSEYNDTIIDIKDLALNYNTGEK